MSLIMGQSAPIDPLVFDDEEAIEALASSVMQLHEGLLAFGKCYTTCMMNCLPFLGYEKWEALLWLETLCTTSV